MKSYVNRCALVSSLGGSARAFASAEAFLEHYDESLRGSWSSISACRA